METRNNLFNVAASALGAGAAMLVGPDKIASIDAGGNMAGRVVSTLTAVERSSVMCELFALDGCVLAKPAQAAQTSWEALISTKRPPALASLVLKF